MVDPFKRSTVDEIFNHPWFTVNLPPYLRAYPHAPGPLLGTLSSLMAPAKKPNQVVIPGVGHIQEFIVDELAQLIDLTPGDIWLALKREGPNSIKVTYCLIRDEHRRHMGSKLWVLLDILFIIIDYSLQSPILRTRNAKCRSIRSPGLTPMPTPRLKK